MRDAKPSGMLRVYFRDNTPLGKLLEDLKRRISIFQSFLVIVRSFRGLAMRPEVQDAIADGGLFRARGHPAAVPENQC